MATPLVLVSCALCPYVQRAAIVMLEKGIPFQRTDIDLANKPDWFLAISPTGKTPLLRLAEASIFESSVICEYLEDIAGPPLHPADPIDRARHRAWMEYASTTLNAVAALYSAPDEPALSAKAQLLRGLFERVEQALGAGPYFEGAGFSMVDAAFAPVLRYFEVIDIDDTLGLFRGLRRLGAWRIALAQRPAVQQAVAPDYHQRLRTFLLARNSALSVRMRGETAAAARARPPGPPHGGDRQQPRASRSTTPIPFQPWTNPKSHPTTHARSTTRGAWRMHSCGNCRTAR